MAPFDPKLVQQHGGQTNGGAGTRAEEGEGVKEGGGQLRTPCATPSMKATVYFLSLSFLSSAAIFFSCLQGGRPQGSAATPAYS